MLDRAIAIAQRLRDWYSQARSRPGYRMLLGALSLAAMAACVWFIWRRVAGSYSTVTSSGLYLETQRLVISSICTAAATALGAWAWVLLVRALGGQLDLARGLSIHLTSNLVKYVPGFILSYASKGILAVRQGVPASVATLSIAVEFAILYICGAVLALLSLPFSGVIRLSLGGRAALQLAAIFVAALLFVILPGLVQRATSQAKSPNALLRPFCSARWSKVALVMIVILSSWCVLAFGFSVLYGQPWSDGWSHMLRHAVALVGALLLGQIAFFAPTGVGVREAVLVALLATEVNAAEVVVLAVVFRLEMILGEIVCALVAVTATRLDRSRRSRSHASNTNG